MSALKRLLPYVHRYRGKIALGVVCLIVVDVIQLYFPLYIARAIDALQAGDIADAHRAIGIMVALAALIVGVRYLWRLLLLGASRQIEQDMRDDFFSKLLRVPQSFLDKSRSGDLLSLSTNDIAVVRQFVGFGIMSLCDSAVMITVSACLMISLSPKLALLVAIPLPLITLAMNRIGDRLHTAHEQTQDCFGDLSARAQEDVYGVRLIRSYGQESNRTREFVGHAELYRQRNLDVIRIQSMFNPLLKFLAGTAAVIALWMGGLEVVRGTLTLGQYVAFSGYVAMLSWPLMALGWIINLIQRARASMERLSRVFDAVEETPENPQAGPARVFGADPEFHTIEVRGLSQVVGDKPAGGGEPPFAFDDVRLSIRRGEWVGIVGKVASGKSALVSRILRIYEPPQGAIFFDGCDSARMDIGLIRRRISYVPQEGFLFSQSILSNFKLGSRAVSDECVEDVAQSVRLAGEIAGWPDGMKTRVGERGVTLSGGQRQRVALGRALLKDADFYILDDPFSAIDLETEDRIFAELRRRLHGRGVILISHRFRSIAVMDRIVVLDGGRIVETGTHDELIRRGGHYARLVEAQNIEETWSARATGARR